MIITWTCKDCGAVVSARVYSLLGEAVQLAADLTAGRATGYLQEATHIPGTPSRIRVQQHRKGCPRATPVPSYTCNHQWQEVGRYGMWDSNGTSGKAPDDIPVTVVLRCSLCGEERRHINAKTTAGDTEGGVA